MRRTGLLILLLSTYSYADTGSIYSYANTGITYNGFGSVYASGYNFDNNDSSPPSDRPSDGDITFKDKSLFAFQVKADFGGDLNATLQLLAKGSEDFNVEAEWAYLGYTISDTHQLRVGRLANTIFYYSEYENVGYAHNFATLPQSVYIGFDFSTVEGISFDSNYSLGQYNLETSFLYGSWEGETYLASLGDTMPFGLKDIVSVKIMLSRDWWSVFAGAFVGKMQAVGLDEVILGYAQPGISAAVSAGASDADVNELSTALKWDNKWAQHFHVGFYIDAGHWIINGEAVSFGIQDSVDAINEGYYIAVGRRFNQLTVLVYNEQNTQNLDYGFVRGIDDPVLQATGRNLMDSLNQWEYKGNGLTLRYDFHPSAALKLGYTYGAVSPDEANKVSNYSLGVDFVY